MNSRKEESKNLIVRTEINTNNLSLNEYVLVVIEYHIWAECVVDTPKIDFLSSKEPKVKWANYKEPWLKLGKEEKL